MYVFNISNIKGIARSINSIIIFSSITGGILSDSFQIFFLGLLCIFSEFFVYVEKEYIFKSLYEKKLIPKFFGRGKRPNGSINCSQFIDDTNFNKPSSDFGMPSGHSQLIMATCVYLIQYVLEHQKNPLDARAKNVLRARKHVKSKIVSALRALKIQNPKFTVRNICLLVRLQKKKLLTLAAP